MSRWLCILPRWSLTMGGSRWVALCASLFFLINAWATTLLTSCTKRKLGHKVKVTTLQDQTTLIMALKSEFECIQLNYCISQVGRGRFFFFFSSHISWGKLPPLTHVLQSILCVSSFNQLCLRDGQLKKHLFFQQEHCCLWLFMCRSGFLHRGRRWGRENRVRRKLKKKKKRKKT